MPKWLQWLSMLLPSTFGIDGFMKIAILGGNLQDVSFQWISLWILTFIYFLIATYAMKTIIKKSTKYMEGPL